MLVEVERETYRADCDDCTGSSGEIFGPRTLASLRLMRDGWHLSTTEQRTHTTCPECASPSRRPAKT